MPYKEKEITKLYYSISEVAEIFGVNASLIRFWEKEFDSIKPQKNRKGNRMFTESDIKNFKEIFKLVREQGYTLQGAQNKINESKRQIKNLTIPESSSNQMILNNLQRIKNSLIEIKDKL
jgi:DNA-binding transcriptional MerR regulator